MFKSIIVGLTLALITSSASAAERVRKPSVCSKGTAVSGGGFAGFVCTDGKSPRLFRRYIEVRFVDAEGKPASYVLGWTR